MSKLISIDPGLRHCGVACFQDGKLFRANLVKSHERTEMGPFAWDRMGCAVKLWLPADFSNGVVDVVIEIPRIYPAAQQKGDQNDLIQLAGVAGALAAYLPGMSTKGIYPRDWKGTIDADVMVARIRDRLMGGASPGGGWEAEWEAVTLPTAKSLQHNVWDAIGIGLHALGRLEPRKVFPR